MLLLQLFLLVFQSEGLKNYTEFQRYDGRFNNMANPNWGAAESNFYRDVSAHYQDGVYKINTSSPSARNISQLLFKGSAGKRNARNLTALFAFFGQVVDFELESTSTGCPLEKTAIPLDKDNVFRDRVQMPFTRAKYDKHTGLGFNAQREQINEKTAWIDASFVYSTQEPWIATMRSFQRGKLLEGSNKGYPPYNDEHIPMNNQPPPQMDHVMNMDRLYVLGDSRSNENPAMLSFAIMLFRWHNVWADRIWIKNPEWGDEEIFQAARRFVIASLQKIIMYDYVPTLLGNSSAIPPYTKYHSTVPPGISSAFASTALRYSMTMIPPGIYLRNNHSCTFPPAVGNFSALRLCQSWWNAQEVVDQFTADSIILGMTSQLAEAEDNVIVEDLLDYSAGPMHFSRLDAVATSIMRSRDFGVPTYNNLREAYGLDERNDFEDINPELFRQKPELLENLKSLYVDIQYLDAFVGGMLETSESGPGELFQRAIVEQFVRLRDADRFWFENRANKIFTQLEIEQIHSITLRDIILDTTGVDETLLQEDVFTWKAGDPCEQPSQLSTDDLEHCSAPTYHNFFAGNEYTFIFSILLLCSVPLLCVAYGMYLVRQRRRMGWDSAFDNFSVSALKSDKSSKYSVKAFEWLSEEHIRQVYVELDSTSLVVRKPRGVVTRRIKFQQNSQIRVIHSVSGASRSHGPYCLIKWERTHDLVLRLPCDKSLSLFLSNLQHSIGPFGGKMSASTEDNELLIAQAETKERRQERLDDFFREAYARAFNHPELKDSAFGEVYEHDSTLRESITKHEFAHAMGMNEDELFIRRIWAVTVTDGSDVISFQECIEVFKMFATGNTSDKYKMLFRMSDLEGTGKVRKSEFADLLKSLNTVVGVCIGDDCQNRTIDALLRRAGVDSSKEYLSLSDFEAIFKQMDQRRPLGMDFRGAKLKLNCNETASLNSFAVPCREVDDSIALTFCAKLQSFMETYRQHIAVLFVFFSVCAMLFFERFWYYRFSMQHRDLPRALGCGVAITRGAAAVNSLCMALILLTVCRNLLTFLRETPIGEYIPFDAAIGFHKIIAMTLGFFSAVHTFGHFVNFYHIATQGQDGMQCLFEQALFGQNFLPSLIFYLFRTVTGLTGVLLVVIMSIIYVFATPYFIRRAYFAFRITHMLNIIFYFLAFLHGLPKLLVSPELWMYCLGPLILFALDKIIGMRQEYERLQIKSAELLPSDIIYLQFKRPASFSFRSGQWVRISSPAFSCSFNEHHAFSIASAPQAPSLELYIKAVGPWTWKLRSEIIRAQATGSGYPLLHLRGPYGDGNQEWTNYDVAILVGGGIGVTPYASTLSDLVLETNSGRHNRVKCKKVYFLWVCPTHKNYEWFIKVLKNVEDLDSNRILETHIFVTQFFHKFDLRTTMLYMCEKHFRGDHAGVSMFTGLRAQNHFGRPNFDAFLKFIQTRHSDTRHIGVFSCGPSAINKQISSACATANQVRYAPSFSHRFETF